VSGPDVNAGLVAKLSLHDLAKKVKANNPDLAEEKDSDVAAFYLQKFPSQISLINPKDQPIAKDLLDGGENAIHKFYSYFGDKSMEGMSLKDAPDFLQKTLQKYGTKYYIGDAFRSSAAHVYPGDTNRIYIDRPGLFDRGVQAHEATHIYQGALREPMKGDAEEERGGEANYNYGGWKGLIEAQKQHKTIRDFTDEQQAEMVGDYVRLQDSLSDPIYMKGDASFKRVLLDEWDEANKAMGPYLRQLMSQPKQDEPESSMLHPGTIDTKPAPPGPPPASVSGAAIPLAGIGGKAAYFDPKDLISHTGLVPKAKKTVTQ
jgi:hypothetical protein